MKTKSDTEYPKEILEIAKRIGCEPGAVAEVRALPPSELAALTDKYLDGIHPGIYQGPAFWQLRPAHDLATPYLIAAFERENPFKQTDESSGLSSPAARALAFLEPGVHHELKEHLLRWLKTGDEAVFKIIKREGN